MAKKQIENRPRKSKFKTMSHTGGNSRPLKDEVVRIGNQWFMKKNKGKTVEELGQYRKGAFIGRLLARKPALSE